jgi:hypothetical protein
VTGAGSIYEHPQSTGEFTISEAQRAIEPNYKENFIRHVGIPEGTSGFGLGIREAIAQVIIIAASLASEHPRVRGPDERGGHDGRTIQKLSQFANRSVLPLPPDVKMKLTLFYFVGPPPRYLFRVPMAQPPEPEPAPPPSASIRNGDGGDNKNNRGARSPGQHTSPRAEQAASSSASSTRPVRAKRPSQALRDSSPLAQAPPAPVAGAAGAAGASLPIPSPGSRSVTPSPARRTHECAEPGCHRVFARAEHLNRHMRVHTQEKRTYCRESDGGAVWLS